MATCEGQDAAACADADVPTAADDVRVTLDPPEAKAPPAHRASATAPPAVPAVTAAAVAKADRARWLPAGVTVAQLRPSAQMFVALVASCLLTTVPASAAAFQNRGVWIAITVTMALEANVGATSRKATLRALGTVMGGVLAVLCVALTAAFTAGWPPGATPGKVAAITLLVATSGAAVQFARSRDAAHDYAYVVCLVTLVIASLSDFTAATWRIALLSVLWRLATIAAGGVVAFAVSNLILPEYASHAVRSTLAKALEDAAELLGGAVDAYVAEEEAPAEGEAEPQSPRSPRSSVLRVALSRAAAGFSGVAGADGGDAGLVSAHAALHALEARLSLALDRYATLLQHAGAERKVRLGEPLSVHRFAAAGAATRAVFTGAVALLHGMETGLHLCALCAEHAPAIRAARAELTLAFAAAGRLATSEGSVEDAEAAVARLEAAVAALAAEVTAQAAWRKLLGRLSASEAASAMDAQAADVALRHNVQALGAVCFALGDAARQLGRIVAEIDPAAAERARQQRSVHDGVVSAPGGAAPASGGGSMGKALRSAAHALDGALHFHLTKSHGAKSHHPDVADQQSGMGKLKRAYSSALAFDVLGRHRREHSAGAGGGSSHGGAREMHHSSSAPGGAQDGLDAAGAGRA